MRETNFKQTDVGEIPVDWCQISLGDVGEVKMCKRVMKYQTSERGDIPFYKIGTFGKQADAYISQELYQAFRERYNYPNKGDILLSAAGTIGRTVVFDGKPSYFQDSNIVWIANDEKLLSNALLYFIYKRLSWVTESGTIPRIYNGIVRSIMFPIPRSKHEQARIAAALSSIDNLISSLTKLIEKKQNVKTATMQQLLSGKKRLDGFTEPWIETEIGKLGRSYSGLSGKSANDFGHGTAKYITFLNVLNNPKIDSSIFEKVDIHEGESQNKVNKGDLLFNTSSETPEEVGICSAMLEDIDDLYLNSFCFGFRPNEDLDPLFMSYWFRGIEGRNLMTTLAQGSTRYNLSKDNMMKSITKIPSKAEQVAIATILDDIDVEIHTIKQKRAKYEAIKKGMMQELLTGRIRLV